MYESHTADYRQGLTIRIGSPVQCRWTIVPVVFGAEQGINFKCAVRDSAAVDGLNNYDCQAIRTDTTTTGVRGRVRLE